jgi:hypothetical protein
MEGVKMKTMLLILNVEIKLVSPPNVGQYANA